MFSVQLASAVFLNHIQHIWFRSAWNDIKDNNDTKCQSILVNSDFRSSLEQRFLFSFVVVPTLKYIWLLFQLFQSYFKVNSSRQLSNVRSDNTTQMTCFWKALIICIARKEAEFGIRCYSSKRAEHLHNCRWLYRTDFMLEHWKYFHFWLGSNMDANWIFK